MPLPLVSRLAGRVSRNVRFGPICGNLCRLLPQNCHKIRGQSSVCSPRYLAVKIDHPFLKKCTCSSRKLSASEGGGLNFASYIVFGCRSRHSSRECIKCQIKSKLEHFMISSRQVASLSRRPRCN